MKKIILFLTTLCLILSACTIKKHPDLTYADDLAKKDLKRPDIIIKNEKDFTYALDYLAYYQIDDEVYFKIQDDYAKKIKNIDQEFEKVYLMADLADVYNCNIETKYFAKEHLIGIHYAIAKDVASYPTHNKRAIIKIHNFDESKKENKPFPLAIEQKPRISCFTSEQLYYLAMHGYCPKPVKGSKADILYQKAKEIIFTYIQEKDSDFMKIKKIYEYLTSNILYDQETAKSSDRYLINRQAYYLEGVLLNHYAVCDGKAKTYALLLNMLGIPCLRTSGKDGKKDHAWNMLKLDQKWYVSCTTYGQGKVIDKLSMISPNYAMMLLAKEDFARYNWAYESDKYPEIVSLLATKAYPLYQTLKPNRLVKNLDELINLVNTIKEKWQVNHKLEFKYVGKDKEKFEEELKNYFKDQKIKIMKVKGDTIYQLIYVK